MAIKKFELNGEERNPEFANNLDRDRNKYKAFGFEVGKSHNSNPNALTRVYSARFKDSVVILEDNARLGVAQITLLCDDGSISQRENEIRYFMGNKSANHGDLI